MNITLVLPVRNEGAFLLDWMAHHLACGASHVVALSNDCEDGTDLILDRLAEMGLVTHLRNDGPYDAAGIQFSGLKRADKLEAVKAADWLLPIDIDEFVNVHVGARTLPDLIEALPEADAITLTWRLFGNGGVVRYEDRPVPHVFERAAPAVMHWPWRAAMFKTLYRNNGTYKKLGVHRPRSPDAKRLKSVRWFDCEGRALPEMFHTKRIFSNYGQSNTKLAQLNHYALGAMESYLLKAARGRAVHSDQTLGMDYWVERNFSAEKDVSIRALDGAVADKRAELAADKRLAELHEGAVAWRKARFDALMLQEPYRALFARLLMTPASTPLPANVGRMLTIYANRGRQSENKGDN